MQGHHAARPSCSRRWHEGSPVRVRWFLLAAGVGFAGAEESVEPVPAVEPLAEEAAVAEEWHEGHQPFSRGSTVGFAEEESVPAAPVAEEAPVEDGLKAEVEGEG